MAATTPTTEPAYIQAGDTTTWQKTIADYPASAGWVLSYRLINAQAVITITATASGDDHLVNIPAATTAAYTAGVYTWVAYVSQGADRYTLAKGSVTVQPDLAAKTAGFEARSTAQKALDDLRAALLGWLSTSGHVQEYEIAGRRMRFATAADIQARIGIAEREVARENAAQRLAAGLPAANRIYVRF